MTDDVSLKEYVESRLCALDKRVDTAVQNIKEGTSSSFQASQKAIDKQEHAQTTYNLGHNDLSRKMEDQYKMMMPRLEAVGLFKAVDDKLEIFKKEIEFRAAELRQTTEKSANELRQTTEKSANELRQSTEKSANELRQSTEKSANELRQSTEKSNESVMKEIASLRETRSQVEGKGLGQGEIIAYLVAAASIGGGIIAFIH